VQFGTKTCPAALNKRSHAALAGSGAQFKKNVLQQWLGMKVIKG